jgi:hypothetical protein
MWSIVFEKKGLVRFSRAWSSAIDLAFFRHSMLVHVLFTLSVVVMLSDVIFRVVDPRHRHSSCLPWKRHRRPLMTMCMAALAQERQALPGDQPRGTLASKVAA